MSEPQTRALARRLAKTERQVSARGEQLAYSALQDGAVREFAGASLVAQYGKQYDGTSTAAVLISPEPPRPSQPLVRDSPGGVVVRWDGTFAAGLTTVAPMDFARMDVVVVEPGEDPILTPPQMAIASPRGGELFVALPVGSYDVYLITRTQAGRASAPSAFVEANALSFPSADGKNAIVFSTQPPTGDGQTVGDIWFRSDANNYIIGQWAWDGEEWVQQVLSSEVIANLDAGKITTGELVGITLRGNLFTTALSAANPGAHWELGSDGNTPGSQLWIRGFSGLPDENEPGGIESRATFIDENPENGVNGATGALRMFAPRVQDQPIQSQITLFSGGLVFNDENTAGGYATPSIDVTTGLFNVLAFDGVSMYSADESSEHVSRIFAAPGADGDAYSDPYEGSVLIQTEEPDARSSALYMLSSKASLRLDNYYGFGADRQRNAVSPNGTVRRANLLPHPKFAQGQDAGWQSVGGGGVLTRTQHPDGYYELRNRQASGTASRWSAVSLACSGNVDYGVVGKVRVDTPCTIYAYVSFSVPGQPDVTTVGQPITVTQALLDLGLDQYQVFVDFAHSPVGATIARINFLTTAAVPAGKSLWLTDVALVNVTDPDRYKGGLTDPPLEARTVFRAASSTTTAHNYETRIDSGSRAVEYLVVLDGPDVVTSRVTGDVVELSTPDHTLRLDPSGLQIDGSPLPRGRAGATKRVNDISPISTVSTTPTEMFRIYVPRLIAGRSYTLNMQSAIASTVANTRVTYHLYYGPLNFVVPASGSQIAGIRTALVTIPAGAAVNGSITHFLESLIEVTTSLTDGAEVAIFAHRQDSTGVLTAAANAGSPAYAWVTDEGPARL